MSITVEFKDYNEMIAFAKVLLAGQEQAQTPTQKQKQETPDKKESKVEDKIPEDEVPFEEETKTYALEDVRASLAKLTRSGKQKEVKELLKSFGADKLTEIKQEDYAALMEKAGAI